MDKRTFLKNIEEKNKIEGKEQGAKESENTYT